jgi:hypothetical protein
MERFFRQPNTKVVWNSGLKKSIIQNLMDTYPQDQKLQELCKPILISTQLLWNNRALKYYLLANNIPAMVFHYEFHALCYEEIDGYHEWHNEKGELHCDLKEVIVIDGHEHCFNMPARVRPRTTLMEWFINGKPISPGVDYYGQTLPMAIDDKGDQFWFNNERELHRFEKSHDGVMLPARIGQRDLYYLNGKLTTLEHLNNLR